MRVHLDGQLLVGDRVDRGDHRGGAGHVGLHVEHAVVGLEREAARVEGDALADEHDALLRALGGFQARWMKRGSSSLPCATARNRPMPSFAARGAVEHGELEAGLARDPAGASVGEALRGQDAGGLVDQVARVADRARGLLRARDRGVRLFGGRGVDRRAPRRRATGSGRQSAFACWRRGTCRSGRGRARDPRSRTGSGGGRAGRRCSRGARGQPSARRRRRPCARGGRPRCGSRRPRRSVAAPLPMRRSRRGRRSPRACSASVWPAPGREALVADRAAQEPAERGVGARQQGVRVEGVVVANDAEQVDVGLQRIGGQVADVHGIERQLC